MLLTPTTWWIPSAQEPTDALSRKKVALSREVSMFAGKARRRAAARSSSRQRNPAGRHDGQRQRNVIHGT